MPISLGPEEILETIDMVEVQNLDIRAVTLGVSLRDCAGSDPGEVATKVRAKVVAAARRLVDAANDIERRYGIPIINKRVAVTPVALICEAMGQEGLYEVARALDGAAEDAGIDFIGGFAALVE
ncbi:MAG: DUF711 family protein, partial [Thermoleophilia bacterium]|nr:DUF711 family protein [Thermoleophilia bacterium]